MSTAARDSSAGECLGCHKPFIKKGPGHKYCHWQCANKSRYAARQAAQCASCGVSTAPGRSICETCRAAQYESDFVSTDPAPAVESLPRVRTPRGRYVYAWFAGDSALPFYVGKGVGNRAWERHERSDGTAHWCQTVRAGCKGFRVEIVRDNLTESGAVLLESALLAFVQLCGGALSNQTGPARKQELLPLTLDASLLIDTPDCPIAQR